MPSILDSCRGAKTLRAFLDSPPAADPSGAPEAADIAAHLLAGCTSCRRHLEASLAHPGVPGRIVRALGALGPEHPRLLPLWFADRPGRAQPPPELGGGDQGAASSSKSAYLTALRPYTRSLVVRDLSPTDHLARARDLLTHAMVSHPADLDRDEWRDVIRHACLAAWEAAFRARDTAAAERYEGLLEVFLEYEHSEAYVDTELSLGILEHWREGRFAEALQTIEEMRESDDIPPWPTVWRSSLFHLLTGHPLAVVQILAESEGGGDTPAKGAERRYRALSVLLRASLVDFSAGSSLREAS